MTEELKPCPFCGGKVTLSTYRDEGYQIVCTNHDWPKRSVSDASVAGDIGLYSWGLGDEAKSALIAAWNRRAQANECRNVRPDRYSFKCSECGAAWYGIGDDIVRPYPKHCPNCGAKVVNE